MVLVTEDILINNYKVVDEDLVTGGTTNGGGRCVAQVDILNFGKQF